MIKNKKAVGKYKYNKYRPFAPPEDWNEIENGYLDLDINTDFIRTISKKSPVFHYTHKPLENAIRKQLRKERQ